MFDLSHFILCALLAVRLMLDFRKLYPVLGKLRYYTANVYKLAT